jgi:transcriptional regulator with XRE-family HTH domain
LSTITVKRDLLESCKDREYREAFNLENVYASVCGQMRNIREQQELSQLELGRKAKMAQERISILEDPNAETKPTLNTLLRIAGALDVGLEVRFIPFSRVLETSVNISEQYRKVDSFEKELPSIEEKLELEEAVAKKLPAMLLAGLTPSRIDHAHFDQLHEIAYQQLYSYLENYAGKTGGLVNPYGISLSGAGERHVRPKGKLFEMPKRNIKRRSYARREQRTEQRPIAG